ncbi:MAG: DUF4136 domain-containing protein [Saprospiraceae bacterium]|nr:DUF4136 domain-containing protein [Saprospiraceae bacterium]
MKLSALLRIVLLAMPLFWHACSPFTKVYAEVEPGANLYQYYSYKWLPNNGILPGDPAQLRVSEQIERNIREAVDAQMGMRGYRLCDAGPDLLLHYHVVIQNRVYYQTEWECKDEHEARSRTHCQRVRPVYYREGTLMVDFMDAENGQQVWRGVAVGVIDQLQPDQVKKRIEDAVRQIFKKYPILPTPTPSGEQRLGANY